MFFKKFSPKTKHRKLLTLFKTLSRTKQKNKIPPLRNSDNALAISDLDKANLFASDLENRFSPNSEVIILDHVNHIESALSNTLPMCLPTKHTTPFEIQFLIKNLPIKKSPGQDLITNSIIKHLPKKAILFLTQLFNSILRLSYSSDFWKHSIITLIFKSGKPPDATFSYRPISLLPTFSKILEKIIFKRIYPIILDKKILPNT